MPTGQLVKSAVSAVWSAAPPSFGAGVHPSIADFSAARSLSSASGTAVPVAERASTVPSALITTVAVEVKIAVSSASSSAIAARVFWSRVAMMTGCS